MHRNLTEVNSVILSDLRNKAPNEAEYGTATGGDGAYRGPVFPNSLSIDSSPCAAHSRRNSMAFKKKAAPWCHRNATEITSHGINPFFFFFFLPATNGVGNDSGKSSRCG